MRKETDRNIAVYPGFNVTTYVAENNFTLLYKSVWSLIQIYHSMLSEEWVLYHIRKQIYPPSVACVPEYH